MHITHLHSHLSRLLLLGAYVLAWQGYKIRGRVSRLGTGAILVAVTCSLIAAGVTGLHSSGLFRGSLSPLYLGLPQVDRWTINTVRYGLGLIVSLCFYLLRLALDRDTTYTLRSRRTLNAIALCLVVEVVLFVIAYAFVPRGNAFGYQHSFDVPAAAIYRIIHDTYDVTINLIVVRYIWPFTRDERGAVKAGLRIFALALVASVLLAMIRTVPLIINLFGGPRMIVDNTTVLKPIAAANHWLFILGLRTPLLIDAARRVARPWRHRRLLSAIRPLWRECATAAPGAIIVDEDTFERRRSECLDVLVQLLSGQTASSPAAHEAAERVLDAVRRYDLEHPHRSVASIVGIDTPHSAPPATGRIVTTMLLDLAKLVSAAEPRPLRGDLV